ncbi:ABC transporter substrate-binding protein [Roseitranquillus sediminis]|uniref:ABC transporter substrate-binding protein n=1 Tax=Roseitranquillus sediminis TaxID=2809051 RepID=UPI001D0C7179|nr:extracellular solute-binding protein [Roseitranquillus sediminis]MBM9595443.1 extracellular solute-binding protein [Roseitranquillus sediminis]
MKFLANGLAVPLRKTALFATVSGLGLTAASDDAGAQSIQVWSGYPELAPFYEHVAEGMADEYPDLEVTVEAINLRDHERRVALGLTSGEAAEVIELASALASRYLAAGLLNQAPDEVSEFVTNPENFSEFFLEGVTWDGEIYGVPLFRGQSALYYNTDMLAEAGLDGPPQTMEEFDTYAEQLTQRNEAGDPVVSGWTLRLSGGGAGIAEKFWINMFQHGEFPLVETSEGKWVSRLNTEAGRAALQQYLHNLYETETVTIDLPADAEAFEREQSAMLIRESWVIGDIAAKAPDLNYATATLPEGSIVSAVNLYISGDGEEEQAAWDFALAAQQPENLLWLLDNVGWLPNRAGLDYSEIVAAKPAFGAFVDYPEDYAFFTTPAIGPIEEVMARMASKLEQAFADPSLAGDDEAIGAFLQETDDEINALLDREGILGER